MFGSQHPHGSSQQSNSRSKGANTLLACVHLGTHTCMKFKNSIWQKHLSDSFIRTMYHHHLSPWSPVHTVPPFHSFSVDSEHELDTSQAGHCVFKVEAVLGMGIDASSSNPCRLVPCGMAWRTLGWTVCRMFITALNFPFSHIDFNANM